MRSTYITRFLILFTSVLLFVTSTSSITQAATTTAKTFRFNLYLEPVTLDPALSSDSTTSTIVEAIFEGLVRTQPNGAIEPGVAESWTISPDGKTYTFTLRANARWSNGDPLVASEFVDAWQRVLSPATRSPLASMLFPIAHAQEYYKGTLTDASQLGFQALDDHTLQIVLQQPLPYFLETLSSPAFFPVHTTSMTASNHWGSQASSIVSNGPFVVTNWTKGRSITLARNPQYAQAEKVHFDQVFVRFINDPDKENNMYRSGAIDWSGITESNIPTYKMTNTMRKETVYPNTASLYYYTFNVTKKPFNNINIRKAFAMSIERSSLISPKSAYGFVPPVIKGATSTFRKEYPVTNFETSAKIARQLLKKGMKEEHITSLPSITLITNGEGNQYVANQITDMWKRNLGVTIKVKVENFYTLLQDKQKKNYQIARSGWSADYNDPAAFLELFTSWNSENTSGWKNANYDAHITKAYNLNDAKARMKEYRAAEKMLTDQMVAIPLYYFNTYFLQKSNVHDVYVDYSGAIHFVYGYKK
ncbi:peptide ABC transporter substrate-binding protein [Paenibacillus kyungheensis]